MSSSTMVVTASACPAIRGSHMTSSHITQHPPQLGSEPSLARLVRRGLLAGGVAGAMSALYLAVVVDGPIDEALAIEAARHGDDGRVHDGEMFSRTTQVIGGMTAGLLYGLVAGLLFSIVFARLRHRLPGSDDFLRSLSLATAGFVTIVLIPGLKYPANPPGVGDPATVNSTTLAFLTLMAMGIVFVMVAWHGVDTLRARGLRQHRATTLGVLFVAIAVSLAWLAWSDAPTVPTDIPADLLWRFRVRSLGGLALQWSLIGIIFGLVTTTRTDRVRSNMATSS